MWEGEYAFMVLQEYLIIFPLDIGKWVHEYMEKQMIDTDLELKSKEGFSWNTGERYKSLEYNDYGVCN